MIITIANQKGGVGKSTIALLFANWLNGQGKDVVVLDADRQATLVFQRKLESDNFSEQKFEYPIYQFSIDKPQKELEELISQMKADNPSTCYLIDAPGNLSENGLVPCLSLADVIVCPFQYERKALDSTGTFIVVLDRILKRYNTTPKTVFVPNRVRTNTGTKEEREVYKQIEEIFLKYGAVSPPIKDLIALQRVDSMALTKEQKSAVDNCFNNLLEICQNSILEH